MMVRDHGKMIQDLQQFAGNRLAGGRQAEVRQTAAEQPQGQAAQPQVRQAGGMRHGGAIDHVAFKQELADRGRETVRRELGQKSGGEFDECYVGMQVGAHLHAQDALHVSINHASPQLAQTLEQGLQTTTAHLQHAKDLAQKLKAQSSGAAENRR